MFIIKCERKGRGTLFRESEWIRVVDHNVEPNLAAESCFGVVLDDEMLLQFGEEDVVYVMSSDTGKTVEVLRKHKVWSS